MKYSSMTDIYLLDDFHSLTWMMEKIDDLVYTLNIINIEGDEYRISVTQSVHCGLLMGYT